MKKLKYVKTFESFQVNEEISLRGLAPIITSLFLTFNSFDASAYGGGRRYRAYATEEVHKISDKIERDLQRLKSETRDPELLRLIESVNTLDGWQASDGMEQVSKVVGDLKKYIESQEINEPLVNDTLNNLTTGDIEVIESDYQMLLQKYEEIDDHYDNMKLIMAIVCTLVAALWVIIGLKFKKII